MSFYHLDEYPSHFGEYSVPKEHIELLKLAAKADNDYITEFNGYFSKQYCKHGRIWNEEWNPLKKNDDAFCLMVKFKIQNAGDEVWVIENTSIDDYEKNPLAATRLAITKFVALTGRDIP